MIPRGTPDISWGDLWAGLRACVPGTALEAPARAAAEAAGGAGSLACSSVRSGFDLLLQALELPPGSEIIVSAITIPDMVRIIEHHGLIPVPVDIDAATLAPPAHLVDQAITTRTRAVLVAQLFGCRADLSAIAAVCAHRRIMLIEDCAQAFDGKYTGHPNADVALFSFGPIKTATALGGAILHVRDRALRDRIAAIQSTYPRQPTTAQLKRLFLFALLKLLALPPVFGWFVGVCRLLGIDYDRLISRTVRSSRTGSLEERLRRRPNTALLTLLARRLRQDHRERLRQRALLARQIIAAFPIGSVPGATAPEHSHWVLPICVPEPDVWTERLRAAGFDASRTASSMAVVAPAGAAPTAERMLAILLYVPLHKKLQEWKGRRRIAEPSTKQV
jgi:dTDP-4-amino-4,6-dideoxygalactose transaminase